MKNILKPIIILFFIYNIFFLCNFTVYSGTIPSFYRTDYTLSLSPNFISVNDINNDDNPDIILVRAFNKVSFLIGNGDGTFQNEKVFNLGENVFNAFFLPGDYNKDGNIDFVLNERILLGDGSGDFISHKIDMGTGDLSRGASGDLNGDGYLDLVVGDSLKVFINNGNGTFGYKKTVDPNMGGGILSLNDYTGDGFPDLMIYQTLNDSYCNVYYSLGKGDGTFDEITGLFGFYELAYYYSPDAKDFDGDGVADFIVCLGEHGHLFLYKWNEDGNFDKIWGIDNRIPVDSSFYNFVHTIDIDKDTNNDIVVLSILDNNGFPSGCLSYYPGNGDGTFGNLTTIEPNLPSSYNLGYGDFNKDGFLDFAVASTDSLFRLSVLISQSTSGIKDEKPAEEILTTRCYPNPANPSTMMSYSIKTPSQVKLSVYSINGQKVATLVDGYVSAGMHSVRFDGSKFASGLYFYKFESAKFNKTGKIMLVK